MAAAYGTIKAVLMLINAGADVDAKNNEGEMRLDLATRRNSNRIIPELTEARSLAFRLNIKKSIIINDLAYYGPSWR